MVKPGLGQFVICKEESICDTQAPSLHETAPGRPQDVTVVLQDQWNLLINQGPNKTGLKRKTKSIQMDNDRLFSRGDQFHEMARQTKGQLPGTGQGRAEQVGDEMIVNRVINFMVVMLKSLYDRYFGSGMSHAFSPAGQAEIMFQQSSRLFIKKFSDFRRRN